MQAELTAKVDSGQMEIWIVFPQLTTVQDFALEDWTITAGDESLHLLRRLRHGPMKRGHSVSFAISGDSIPESVVDVTFNFRFRLDQHHFVVTGGFRKERQGTWTGVKDSLKLEQRAD